MLGIVFQKFGEKLTDYLFIKSFKQKCFFQHTFAGPGFNFMCYKFFTFDIKKLSNNQI